MDGWRWGLNMKSIKKSVWLPGEWGVDQSTHAPFDLIMIKRVKVIYVAVLL